MKPFPKNRFWENVQKSEGCWIWTGMKNPDGYGLFFMDGKKRSAHRVLWQMRHGVICKEQYILHECDNPACVNPDHLFLGTQDDNMEDMRQKGRGPLRDGERNPRAKLTVKDVIAIRQSGHGLSVLAKQFGVSSAAIWQIRIGNNWKHLR